MVAKAIEIMNLSVKAKKDGHIQGLEGEIMNMPDLYSADEITRKAYEEGFQSGQQEQLEKLKKEYKQEGYKQGYALKALSVPFAGVLNVNCRSFHFVLPVIFPKRLDFESTGVVSLYMYTL